MVGQRTIKKSILRNSLITFFVPLFVFIFFSIKFISGIYVDEVTSKNQIITMNLSERFGLLNEEPENLTDYIEKKYLEKQGVSGDVSFGLNKLVSAYSYILNIEIINSSGDVVSSAINNADIGINRSGEDFFLNLSNVREGIYWSTPYVSTATGSLIYSMARKTNSKYYILIYISLKSLSESAKTYAGQFGNDIHVEILDQSGRYISHEDINKVNTRMIDGNVALYREMVDKKTPYVRVKIEDEFYIANASKMPTSNWYVVVYQPTQSVFGYMNLFMTIFAFVLFATIIITLLFSLRFSGKINDFFLRMNQSMDRAVKNDFNSEHVDFRYRELNELFERFQNLMVEIKQRDKRLYQAAYYDALSGLGNRLLMHESIDKLIARNAEEEIALVLINVDRFKVINDIYGHDIGDKLIRHIAHELKTMVQANDCLAFHLSGDEFAIVVPAPDKRTYIQNMLAPINKLMTEGLFIGDRFLRVQVTIGISYYPRQASDGKTLYQYADIALIEGKDRNKGNINIYDFDMRIKIESLSKMDLFLRESLKNNRFELYFQPQINVSDGSIYGFEALIRLRNYNGDFIPPLEFITVAESTGFIVELGDWIINQAIWMHKQLNQEYHQKFRISINISTIQMQSAEFPDRFFGILENYHANISLIELEITESVFINEYSTAPINIDILSKAGTCFSLDDFGTGYSSLSYLATLPFKVLKIDRMFIADMENSVTKIRMLESIIDMGHRLKLTIIVEGVETQEQFVICKQFGVDIIQGYYYSKPLNTELLRHFIEERLA
ncbi:MAG: hypothetical protein PWP24_76 [Clostridiales bacterium]|nr:hypothetical protein [Clostridiales bacterium]